MEGLDSARRGCRNVTCVHDEHHWLCSTIDSKAAPQKTSIGSFVLRLQRKLWTTPSASLRQAAATPSHLMVYSRDGVGLRARIFPLLSLGTSESGSENEGRWRQDTSPSGWEQRDPAGTQPFPLWMESHVWRWVGREEGSPSSQTGHGHYSSQERQQLSEERDDTAFNKWFRKQL